jgi:hypothetical protein
MIHALLLLLPLSHADVVADLQAWRSARLAEHPPSIGAETYRRAIDGETVTGIELVDGVKAAQGYGLKVYQLPIKVLWKAITDEPHFVGWLPLRVSRVVQGAARTDDHILYQYMELPIVSDRWWMTRMRFNTDLYRSSQERAWELAWDDRTHDVDLLTQLDAALFEEGEPVSWSRGAWLLVPLDADRTLVEYHFWTDPGGAVPVTAAMLFAIREVAKTMETMGALAHGHIPTCRSHFRGVDNEPM